MNTLCIDTGFPGGSVVESLPPSAGDAGETALVPGPGRFPGGRNGSPLQYSCLENPMDRGAWWATVCGVAGSDMTEHVKHIIYQSRYRKQGFGVQLDRLMIQRPSLSCVLFFVTLYTVAHQAPLSMGFSRQEYWSGLPCPPPGDLPNPGMELRSPSNPVLTRLPL